MSNARELHKKELSSKLLNMKFMQRQQERELRDRLEEAEQKALAQSHWKVEYQDSSIEKPKLQVEYEPSYLSFNMTGLVGRKSYQSFNEDIEKVAVDSEKKQRQARELAVEKSTNMDDAELAQRMTSVTDSPGPEKKKRRKEKW
ncbi:hypothetical protein K493DRAFT_304701 [Basidiobolus meristosporus CBS 931.73]|uniref:M-phase phosphoprotein 6 n=1 Tax=Basidiobolus meristosporus CBS 931.73 TaxID=1314790 RepID=A0A1Y1XYW3_9FUNG|nr:hypothetical protein K493DRAFT_304701 [Basidiobolus meristosporus CBS 931.73]|eukprot:ORX90676.1 hypothetical protein K493DRAFT_304701 [Basidiobolus meristosporus CBS 931.73]